MALNSVEDGDDLRMLSRGPDEGKPLGQTADHRPDWQAEATP
jgi:hypothetical protein